MLGSANLGDNLQHRLVGMIWLDLIKTALLVTRAWVAKQTNRSTFGCSQSSVRGSCMHTPWFHISGCHGIHRLELKIGLYSLARGLLKKARGTFIQVHA